MRLRVGRTQVTVITMGVLFLLLILYRMSYGDTSVQHAVIREDDVIKTQPDNSQIILQSNENDKIMSNVKEKLKVDDHFGRKLMLPRLRENVKDEGYKEDDRFVKPRSVPLFHGFRIVHLDLKGAPPRLSFYEEFFPLLKEMGATGILIEYEDMFPYWGPQLQDISAHNAYTKSDIKHIIKLAYSNGLMVIPLIQTFGHLEFLLKLQKFSDMREVPKYPQVICPSHNATFSLLTAMIDQIVKMHPGIKYLHIGCDEVYYLGECIRCAMAMVDHKWSKTELFLNHVTLIARYVREKHPGVVPLMWDDEFRELSQEELREWDVAQWVEPVVWKYTPDVASYIASDVWEKYAAVFHAVWIASAFKGATGPDKYVTDSSYHLENHRAWMDVVAMYSDRIKFRGVIITGWQRYDHFSVLCELLPPAIPSLAISLAFIQGDNKEMSAVPRKVSDMLKCDVPLSMTPGAGRAHCSFPGAGILDVVERLYLLAMSIEHMTSDSTMKGWMTQYNIDNAYSSPSHVEHATAELDRCRMELGYIERDMKVAMADVYDAHTVTEWLATYLKPVGRRLQGLWDAKERLLSKDHWPRRPLEAPATDSEDL
ncbi:hexosaminidase D-like [Bacillus rossius redtenbacheri]|uniref:hexosaminidase D-like n=1 Tax=Bacillus rossius redtenbacheri TaxID=93214 RepID=UPI002FDE1CB1